LIIFALQITLYQMSWCGG